MSLDQLSVQKAEAVARFLARENYLRFKASARPSEKRKVSQASNQKKQQQEKERVTTRQQSGEEYKRTGIHI
ncbi:hypothetical protein AMEX_G24371 [Astyanax mexicanus]|uniref:Uncharacterized protein n=1 Tax=Astyanax mexicanus TaxID=7994 RepID=A0A8T2KSZ8_ASTMX|nr:hypothetical protein AMEX_G24371 [Astyanax mexicanus]